MNTTWRLRPDRRLGLGLIALIMAAGMAGCTADIDTEYGRSRGKSINGTNAFFELIRQRGHTVRSAVRYNEPLGDWAKVIVRFAPLPGPPARQEAEWLTEWLSNGPGRKLVYIPGDFQTNDEFWTRMLAALPKDAPQSERDKIEGHKKANPPWRGFTPKRVKDAASPEDWFATAPTDSKTPDAVTVASKLEGPWAEGIKPSLAALPTHEALKADNGEDVLLIGDDRKLVLTWTFSHEDSEDGHVLVLANGAYLLNGGLLNKARRPLANRVVDWIGDDPSHVVFVEGNYVMADVDAENGTSPLHLLTVEPFNWIIAHLAIFGTLLCLSLAATIGRPRPEPAGEIERPSAHPIALGATLARTRQVAAARELLATYHRWRQTKTSPIRTDMNSSSSSPRRAPRA